MAQDYIRSTIQIALNDKKTFKTTVLIAKYLSNRMYMPFALNTHLKRTPIDISYKTGTLSFDFLHESFVLIAN